MSTNTGNPPALFDQVEEHVKGLKIHAMISSDLVQSDRDALNIPLCQATDEQILAEIARRKLDIHANITQVFIFYLSIYIFMNLFNYFLQILISSSSSSS